MRSPDMRRCEFITMIGGAAAWPLVARAQQPDRMRRIGVLMAFAESDREGQALVAAFREGLQKLGWAEGRNIRIDIRWALTMPSERLHLADAPALAPFHSDLGFDGRRDVQSLDTDQAAFTFLAITLT